MLTRVGPPAERRARGPITIALNLLCAIIRVQQVRGQDTYTMGSLPDGSLGRPDRRS